jgi:hypothetical protein
MNGQLECRHAQALITRHEVAVIQPVGSSISEFGQLAAFIQAGQQFRGVNAAENLTTKDR